MASLIDDTKPAAGAATTASVRLNFTRAKAEITALQIAMTTLFSAMPGEIRIWPTNNAPINWHTCDGSLLFISAYPSLFAVVGTIYGGDGITTFGIPDIRSRMPIGVGAGTGLSAYAVGNKGGAETTTLTTNELPAHTHGITSIPITAVMRAANAGTQTNDPTGHALRNPSPGTTAPYTVVIPTIDMAAGTVTGTASGTSDSTGTGTAANTISPYFALNFIICLRSV